MSFFLVLLEDVLRTNFLLADVASYSSAGAVSKTSSRMLGRHVGLHVVFVAKLFVTEFAEVDARDGTTPWDVLESRWADIR